MYIYIYSCVLCSAKIFIDVPRSLYVHNIVADTLTPPLNI